MEINTVRRKFLKPNRENNTFFDYNLLIVLAFYLETRSIGIENTRIESIAESKLVDVRATHDLFFNSILPEMSDGKTEKEIGIILEQLLDEVVGTIKCRLYYGQ